MKKSVLVLLGFVVLLSSCGSIGYIRPESIERNEPLKGTLAFASLEVKNPVATYSEGNYQYTISFSRPEILLDYFIQSLEPETRSNIVYVEVPTNHVDQFHEELRKAGVRTYVAAKGFIPVFDANEGEEVVGNANNDSDDEDEYTYPLDEDCLKFLNENIHADYYLVCLGEMRSYQIPNIFNLFNFTLEPEFRIVIYDKTGKKVFSKSYTHLFEKIEESYQVPATYGKYFLKNLEMHKEQINKDLKILLGTMQKE